VCKVSAWLEKPEFSNRGQIGCTLDIENLSKVKIKGIEVTLVQVVSMEAEVDADNSAQYSFRDKLLTKNFGPYKGSQIIEIE
jgi:hypothetical protein